MYGELVSIIAPVVICASLGYGWARLRLPFDRDVLTAIIMNIGVPCLILRGITGLDVSAPRFLTVLGIALAILVFCMVVGGVVLTLLRQPLRSYLPPVVYGNAGNMGLPLCLFAFGEEGLGLAVAVYLAGSVSQFVLAPPFQGRQPPWRTLVQTPVIYAAIAGLAVLGGGIDLPVWLGNTIELLGGLAIPLMLLMLGYALANFHIGRAGAAFGIAIFRLSLGFGAGVLAVEIFQLEGTMRGVVIIESAMPVAVFNYLLAARYNRHPADVAGAVLVSTLLGFALLPGILLFALR